MRMLALTLAMAAPAAAQDAASPMAGAFGNTIVSVQPDGVTTRTYVDPDGSYKSVANGAETTGRWTVKKGLICYAVTGSTAPPLCSLGPKKKVGNSWRIFLSDDQSVKVSLVAGRP